MAETNWTIGRKLFTSFGAIVVASLVMGIVTFICVSRINGDIDVIVNQAARMRVTTAKLQTDVAELTSLMRGMQIRALTRDRATLDRYHEEFGTRLKLMHDHVEFIKPAIRADAGREYVRAMTDAEPRLAELDHRLYQKLTSGDVDGGIAIFRDDFLPLAVALQGRSETYIGFSTTVMSGAFDAAKTSEARAEQFSVVVLLINLVVGVGIVFVVRRINGDLRLTANSLSDGASQIASAAGEVSASSQSVAKGASEQAAFIEQTSASAEEVNAMTRRNTESSQSTATIVTDSQRRFAETNRSLEEMVTAMEGINASSEQISRIIKVIDQIAFQTNILALNAAVEAARAGEAGAGFAVVADEVRNLAHRSAQAAQDTATLIEESITKSHDGRVKVDQVAQAIRSITADSTQVKVLVDEIKTGSQEQSKGVQQISQAIQRMEKITQSNAASAEQTAAAADELSAQSRSVREIVDHLASLVGGVEAQTEMPSIRQRPSSQSVKTAVKVVVAPKRSGHTQAAAPAKATGQDAFPMEEESFLDF